MATKPSITLPSVPADVRKEMDDFIAKLRCGQITSSYGVARTVAQLMRRIIGQCKWETTTQVIDLVQREGQVLMQALPTETVIGNMVRRTLRIIREEHRDSSSHEDRPTSGFNTVPSASSLEQQQADIFCDDMHAASSSAAAAAADNKDSLHSLFNAKSTENDFNQAKPNLKLLIIEAIQELMTELETSTDNIAMQAHEHIHSNEIIMTIGRSRTVEAFLKHAARKRKFQVIVAEGAPFFQGHQMAQELSNAKIPTTIITDSAIFAIMSRVNKVIIGTHTVMANGGLKAVSGAHTLALAARHYSVPLIVCAAMYKLSSQHLCFYDQAAFNQFVSPESVVAGEASCANSLTDKIHVVNPVFDYVPPELVTLFISNIGGNAPSYVYRLLSELYDMEDNVKV